VAPRLMSFSAWMGIIDGPVGNKLERDTVPEPRAGIAKRREPACKADQGLLVSSAECGTSNGAIGARSCHCRRYRKSRAKDLRTAQRRLPHAV
jgi:hypothetical protein